MDFVYVTCQLGAEPALKREVSREHPELRFAYSRPGFVTFKFVAAHLPLEHFRLRSVFARAWGHSLGRVKADTLEGRTAAFRDLLKDRSFSDLHVWERDHFPPRDHVPIGRTPAAQEAEAAVRQAPETSFGSGSSAIADCILVEADEWWAGWHLPRSVPDHWPGGQLPDNLPENAVSRGYLKMKEALLWSEVPVRPGDVCVEFGCAPGGASQQLLEKGLHVIGIDPAEMDPIVLADSRFTHVRARPRELKKKLFRGIPWLVSDINLPPAYTLDTLEEIVGYAGVDLRGMILTLKLPDWSLADELPGYLNRLRGWGYGDVRARQLHYNRQEVCVAAKRN